MYFVLLWWRRLWTVSVAVGLTLLAGFVTLVSMHAVLDSSSRWWPIVESSAVVLWIQWALGMLAAEAHCGLVRLPPWCRSIGLVVVAGAAALVAEAHAPWLAVPLWGVTFFGVVNRLVSVEGAGRWPRTRVVDWLAGLGLFSYSLYLVHFPVQVVADSVLRRAWPAQGTAAYLGRTVVLIASACVIARLFFVLIERRFLRREPE